MKAYEAIEIELIVFDVPDVVTASGDIPTDPL
jgi:hypothetical protein